MTRALGVTLFVGAAVLLSAVLERTLHEGLESMLLARLPLLVGPALRRWLERGGALEAQPAGSLCSSSRRA